MQAGWDNCSHCLPALPKYPQGAGFLPLPPLPAPAVDGRAPGMPSPWAPGPVEVRVLVTDQCQPPGLSGVAAGSSSWSPGGYRLGLRLDGAWGSGRRGVDGTRWGSPADLCPLQMKSSTLASTLTSWARTQPSSAPWASRQP